MVTNFKNVRRLKKSTVSEDTKIKRYKDKYFASLRGKEKKFNRDNHYRGFWKRLKEGLNAWSIGFYSLKLKVWPFYGQRLISFCYSYEKC